MNFKQKIINIFTNKVFVAFIASLTIVLTFFLGAGLERISIKGWHPTYLIQDIPGVESLGYKLYSKIGTIDANLTQEQKDEAKNDEEYSELLKSAPYITINKSEAGKITKHNFKLNGKSTDVQTQLELVSGKSEYESYSLNIKGLEKYKRIGVLAGNDENSSSTDCETEDCQIQINDNFETIKVHILVNEPENKIITKRFATYADSDKKANQDNPGNEKDFGENTTYGVPNIESYFEVKEVDSNKPIPLKLKSLGREVGLDSKLNDGDYNLEIEGFGKFSEIAFSVSDSKTDKNGIKTGGTSYTYCGKNINKSCTIKIKKGFGTQQIGFTIIKE
jgi:hypothetical protein